ncbi:serine protease [Saccharothrix xinjiangensis]|uniref:Serine protease n=1 Tax=Saccharothrix xinjiangensis TaxID=204798 RepID=A0ABV9Y1H6_9PSEU
MTRVLPAVAGLTAALLAHAAAPAHAAQPSSPEELAAAIARPAIVLITVEWHGWVRDKRTGEVFGGAGGYTAKTSCTGVVVSPDGHVATASHCVHTGPEGGAGALFGAAVEELAGLNRVVSREAAVRELAEHAVAEGAVPDRPVDRDIRVERMEATGDGPVRDVAPATVVDLVAPTDGDVAVLKVPRDRLPALEVRRDRTPVGTPVLAIGYPGSAVDQSLEPSNKNGQVSARRTRDGRPFYEFSAAAAHGMSGGPVVDAEGRVVGLISQAAPGETQSFNFAAASETLVELVEGKGIAFGPGDHDRDYRTGLDRWFEGDHDGAVEAFDDVLAASPGHLQATEHRRLAVERGGRAGDDAVLVVLALLFAGIAVGTGTAAAAIALTRRRAAAGVSGVDAPAFGAPASPVGFGVQPQPRRDADTDQVQRREALAAADDETEQQARPGRGGVQPGTPPAGEPGAAQPHQRQDADGGDQTERL